MSHHPMTDFLKKALSGAVKDNAPAKDPSDGGRRKFLRQAVYTAGSLAIAPLMLGSWCSDAGAPGQQSVAIIGGGIAGLNACYQLKKQGIRATIYEAGSKIGGRMFTVRDEFGEGITTDIGGEFVDSTHTDLIGLMKELGLPFYDLRQDELQPKEIFFDGKHLTNDDLKNALQPFVKQLLSDIRSLPEVLSYETASHFQHLDNLTITEYISAIGISGWLYEFINVVLTREYGMEASEQSAINFLIMFTPPKDHYYQMFGDDHEVMKIKGGSQQLCDALYEKIKESVVLKHTLTSISASNPSGYQLTFSTNHSLRTVEADYILLAIPFSILRMIPVHLEMPEGKQKCINEMGYGNSCKFILGMDSKPWRKAGKQGYTFTDLSVGAGWDSSQLQSSQNGSFTVFGGGQFGDSLSRRTADDITGDFVPQLERIYPGMAAAFNKKHIKYCWAGNPLAKGGYSSFKKGQWSTLAGWESVPVGNVYFAGEHVSREFQGYMNGGAQTGRVAARRGFRSARCRPHVPDG